LAEVVARALLKNLDLRYASGQDMANDLLRSRMQPLAPGVPEAGAMGGLQGSPATPGASHASQGFETTVLMPPPAEPSPPTGAPTLSNRRGDA
jgi:hypothetical protein